MFFAYKMKIVKQISVKLCNTPVDLNDHSSVNMWNILLFLEKNFGKFDDSNLDQLVSLGLRACKTACEEEKDFTASAIEIACLDEKNGFKYLNLEEI